MHQQTGDPLLAVLQVMSLFSTAVPVRFCRRAMAPNYRSQMLLQTFLLLACVIWLSATPQIKPPDRIADLARRTKCDLKPCLVKAYSMSMSLCRPLRHRNHKRSTLLYLALVLLGSSWDIELNPGPLNQASAYPCGICQDNVTFEQDAICCDGCDVWSHKHCLNMSTTLFDHLANTDVMWICPLCSNPNYSAILFNSPVTEHSNQFATLAESMQRQSRSKLSYDSDIPSPRSVDTPPFDLAGSADSSAQAFVFQSSPHSSFASPLGASSPKTPIYKPKRKKLIENFKVAIINCQSIKNKVTQFGTFMDVTQPDIVIGTESWLTPEVSNSKIFPAGYNILRKDRVMGDKKSGGGVFLLVRSKYTCTEINTDSDCEMILAKLELHNQKSVTIGAFYRPPWADEEYMEKFISCMSTINPNHDKNLWITGDFNLPHIDWENMCVNPGNSQATQSDLLLEYALDQALTQLVTEPTRKENMLDLFFTTSPSLVNRISTTPPLGEGDHNIVFVDVNTKAATTKK